MTRGSQYQFIWTNGVDGLTRICSVGTRSDLAPDLTSIVREIVHHTHEFVASGKSLHLFVVSCRRDMS